MDEKLRRDFVSREIERMADRRRQPTEQVMPVFDAAALKMAVRFRHARHSTVMVEELRTHSGVGGGERYLDMFVLGADTRYGCSAEAYEIKVSRADFLRDIKQPLKQRVARMISDRFWFVTPPGLLEPGEIPLWAGLLEPKGYGWKEDQWDRWRERDMPLLKEVVPAPLRSKDPPSWPLVVSLLRREPIISEISARTDTSDSESKQRLRDAEDALRACDPSMLSGYWSRHLPVQPAIDDIDGGIEQAAQ